jgi:hypothetical protein
MTTEHELAEFRAAFINADELVDQALEELVKALKRAEQATINAYEKNFENALKKSTAAYQKYKTAKVFTPSWTS